MFSEIKSFLEQGAHDLLQSHINDECRKIEEYFMQEYNKEVHIEVVGTGFSDMSVNLTGDIENKEEMTKFVIEQITEKVKGKFNFL